MLFITELLSVGIKCTFDAVMVLGLNKFHEFVVGALKRGVLFLHFDEATVSLNLFTGSSTPCPRVFYSMWKFADAYVQEHFARSLGVTATAETM